MKEHNNRWLAVMTAALGLICLGLRVLMLATGIDDKGLLVRGNIPNTAMWVVAIGYLAALWIGTGNLGGNGGYTQNFPASSVGGWLGVAGGLLMVVSVFDGTVPQRVLAAVAAAFMAFTGYCRYERMRPNFWFHGLICVYFLVSLITRYQRWSADPQLHEYGFQLLACVMLMLFSCHRACCEAGRIQRRAMVFSGLAACFFCTVSLSDSASPFFYAAALLWTAGSIGSIRTLPQEDGE